MTFGVTEDQTSSVICPFGDSATFHTVVLKGTSERRVQANGESKTTARVNERRAQSNAVIKRTARTHTARANERRAQTNGACTRTACGSDLRKQAIKRRAYEKSARTAPASTRRAQPTSAHKATERVANLRAQSNVARNRVERASVRRSRERRLSGARERTERASERRARKQRRAERAQGAACGSELRAQTNDARTRTARASGARNHTARGSTRRAQTRVWSFAFAHEAVNKDARRGSHEHRWPQANEVVFGGYVVRSQAYDGVTKSTGMANRACVAQCLTVAKLNNGIRVLAPLARRRPRQSSDYRHTTHECKPLAANAYLPRGVTPCTHKTCRNCLKHVPPTITIDSSSSG